MPKACGERRRAATIVTRKSEPFPARSASALYAISIASRSFGLRNELSVTVKEVLSPQALEGFGTSHMQRACPLRRARARGKDLGVQIGHPSHQSHGREHLYRFREHDRVRGRLASGARRA